MSIKDYFVAKQREIERKKRLETANKVGLGLVIGTLVGSAAGVLLAPKSGKETREDIKTFAENSADQVKEQSAKLGEEVSKTYKSAVEKIINFGDEKLVQLKKVGDDVEDKAKDVKDQAEKTAKEVKDEAEKKAEKVKDNVKETADNVKKETAKTVAKGAEKVEDTAGKVKKEAEKKTR